MFDEYASVVAGQIYYRSLEQLAPSQRKAVLEHIQRSKPDSIASAIAMANGAEIFAAMVGYRPHWSKNVELRRTAVTAVAKLGKPIIAHSFSREFINVVEFVKRESVVDARIARLVVSEKRLDSGYACDMLGAAGCKREAASFLKSGFREIGNIDVDRTARDTITKLSAGLDPHWFFMGDDDVAKQQAVAARDAERATEILANVQNGRPTTGYERAEFRRLSGTLTIFGSTLAGHYATASIPSSAPSITLAQATDLIIKE